MTKTKNMKNKTFMMVFFAAVIISLSGCSLQKTGEAYLPEMCGNSICDSDLEETAENCPDDCAVEQAAEMVSTEDSRNFADSSVQNIGIQSTPGEISSCQTIDTPGTYTMQNDVSSTGTCFNITANNVTLDGNGKTLTYNTGNYNNSYGIIILGVRNNITIKNFNNGGKITDGGSNSGNDESAIYVDNNLSNSSINNNVISVSGGWDSYGSNGISFVDAGSSSNNITNNNITSIDGLVIRFSSSSSDTTISGNTMTSSDYGILFYSSSSGDTISGNTINSYYVSIGFISPSSSSDITISGNNITSTNDGGIYLDSSSSATISGNTINSYYSSIRFISNSSNDIISGNTISSTADYDLEVGFSGEGRLTNLSLINQTISKYLIKGLSNITFTNTNYGSISLINMNGTGTNLIKNATSDIRIGNNSAYVNSGQTGLNKRANVTLLGLPTNFANPAILKDGVACGSSCYNFTSLNAGTVRFNVSSWSNYSIGEGPVQYCPNNMAGNGTINNPCNITSWADLNAARNNLSLSYALTSNLNASSPGYSGLGDNWTPIGTCGPSRECWSDNYGYTFQGSFNGNGFSILNLTIPRGTTDTSANYYLGLFGFVYRGSISNIHVGVNITGYFYVGGLVGSQSSSSITHSSSTATLTGGTNSYRFGGLVGYQSSSSIITHSSSTATLTGGAYSNDFGGLVGSQESSNITNSFSTATLTGGSFSDRFGGLVGSQESSNITNSSSTATLACSFNCGDFGGLVGGQWSCSITNSFSTATLTGGAYSNDFGGLVGGQGSCSITNSSSTATLTGGADSYGFGGLVGEQYDSNITNSSSTATLTGGADSYAFGGLVGYQESCSITNSSSTATLTGDVGSYSYGGLLGELGYDGCSGDCGSISSSSVSILDSSSLSAGSDVGLIVGKLWGDATVTNTYGTVYDSQYGNITFLTWNVTSASGGNLTQQIYLNNNSAYVNGSNSGLNKSANITLIGLPTNFTNPIILKDGVACGSANYNFTSLNAGTVVFNVSSWSNYSIGEGSLYCGDALIQCFETCDDNNLNNLDGCSSTCSVETGYTCSGTPSICARCGDGLIKGSEVCDDNNLNNLDGCSSTCSVETGYTCSGTPSVCTTICGDGLIKGSEVCDDNNLNNLDGCSSTCSVETGYTCSGTPSICARCGDGNCTNGIETCSSCPTDCGSCPSSGGSSSGGGGGGGSRKTYQCNDKKDNDNDGLIDLNDPGCTDKNDDDEYNYICKEKWVCTNWEPAVCPAEQTQTRTCEDVNHCGTQTYKEPTVKYCKYNEPVQDVQEAKQTTQEQPSEIAEPVTSKNNQNLMWYIVVGIVLALAVSGAGYIFYSQKGLNNSFQETKRPVFQQTQVRQQNIFDQGSVMRLETYFIKMMSQGYPRDKIRETILKVGWKQDIVDYVFARIK